MAAQLSKRAIRKAQETESTGAPSPALPAAVPAAEEPRYGGLERARILPLGDLDLYAERVNGLWDKTLGNFIQIGRYLNTAREEFNIEDGAFMKTMRPRLKFSWEWAHQARRVAAAIDGNLLAEEELPPPTIAYQLATLTRDQLALARERGLVRPDIKRREVIAFKEEFRPPRPAAQKRLVRDYVAQLRRLRELEQRLRLEGVDVDDLTAEIDAPTIDGTATLVDGD